jgi:hypothetical protein
MTRIFPTLLVLLLFAQGCEPPATQYPPGTVAYPSNFPSTPAGTSNPQTQAQANSARKWQNAQEAAARGRFFGAVFGGPFGVPASWGLGALGFIYGMLSEEAVIEEENAEAQAKYKKEIGKNDQLEAAIEQELARQRGLENQIAGAGSSGVSQSTGQPAPIIYPSPGADKPLPDRPPEKIILSSLSKPAPQTPAPFRNVEVKDINGDGIPDLWIYYNPNKPGEVVRQEESTRGDGRVDTWSYFKDGQLMRRDVDAKGAGRPDTVFFYDNNMIVREERDENGQGMITFRAVYQNNRIAKVEKDTRGSGRPDQWIFYDPAGDGEVIVKEERDLDGDGAADLWSYYENGRLVRRDVSAVGLEILSKQEQLPASAEVLRVSPPGT